MRQLSNPYRITALFMAFLLIVSSTGVVIDMHFCQGNLKSMRLIGQAPNCHDMDVRAQLPACHQKQPQKNFAAQAPSTDREAPGCAKDCCSHEVMHAQLETEYPKSEVRTGLDVFAASQIIMAAFTMIVDHAALEVQDHYLDYKPPQFRKDIPVLLQSFLI